MINNITLTTDLILRNNDVNAMLKEWQKYTDSTVNDTYQSTCSSKTKDFWSQNKEKCLGYTYTPSTESSAGTTSCLVFYNDWNNPQVAKRYTSALAGCTQPNSDFISFADAAVAYHNAMNKYVSYNTDLLNQLIENIKSLDSSFAKMSTKYYKV